MIDNDLLFKAMFENATEGIIISNLKGEIELANKAALAQFHYEKHELEGKSIDVLVPDEFRNKHTHHRESFNNKPTNRSMGINLDLFGKRKNGDLFPLEISLTNIKIENEVKIISFIIDITIRKKIEAEVIKQQKEIKEAANQLKSINEQLEKKVSDRTKVLQEAIRELERSQKELKIALSKEKDLNDLKTRFISMASHEFRTPLSTILSSASLIGEYDFKEFNEKKSKHVTRIKSGVSNLNEILTDFLSISKLEEGKVIAIYRDFDLYAMALEIINDLKHQVKKNQVINLEFEGKYEVCQDAKLIKNILINLISNAIKFTNDDGNILVKCHQFENKIDIVVSDNGIGISEDDLNHMFERFFRAKNASNIQGTGLGLHIVSNYVSLLKGKIDLKSKLNEGTTIYISLPKNQNHENDSFN